MAELNSSPEKTGGKSPRKKLAARVDLTAMVDLAFLLITFFMLTTSMNKPVMFNLAMPDPTGESGGDPASRSLTLCLGSHHQVVSYMGVTEHPAQAPTVEGFDRNGLRKVIADMKKQVFEQSGKSLLVVVKPSDKSLYGDMVNALDELKIAGVDQYGITDITAKDISYLKDKKVY